MKHVNEGTDVKGTDLEVKRPRFQGKFFHLSAGLLHTCPINVLSLSSVKGQFNSNTYNFDAML